MMSMSLLIPMLPNASCIAKVNVATAALKETMIELQSSNLSEKKANSKPKSKLRGRVLFIFSLYI